MKTDNDQEIEQAYRLGALVGAVLMAIIWYLYT